MWIIRNHPHGYQYHPLWHADRCIYYITAYSEESFVLFALILAILVRLNAENFDLLQHQSTCWQRLLYSTNHSTFLPDSISQAMIPLTEQCKAGLKASQDWKTCVLLSLSWQLTEMTANHFSLGFLLVSMAPFMVLYREI